MWLFNKKKAIVENKTVNINDLLSYLDPGEDPITDGYQAWEKNSWVRWGVKLIISKMASAEYFIQNSKGKPNDIAYRVINSNINGFDINGLVKVLELWRIISGYGILYIDDKGKINFARTDSTNIDKGVLSVTYSDGTVRSYKDYFVYREDPIDSSVRGESAIGPIVGYANAEYQSIVLLNALMKSGALINLMMVNDNDVNKNQIDKLITDFQQRYSGIDNAPRIPFISGGWKPIQNVVDFQKMNIDKIDAIVKNQVSTVLGVPISMMNDTESNTAAREKLVQDRKRFIYDVVIPRTNDFVSFFNDILSQLYPRKGYKLGYDYSQLLDMVADRKLEEEIRTMRVQAGYMTRNEAREQIGMDPKAGADTLLVPVTLMPLSSDNSKALKKVNTKSAKVLHDQLWKAYYKRVMPQEKKLVKVIGKFFDKMERQALERLDKKQYKGYLDEESLLEEFGKLLKPYMVAFAQQAGDSTIMDYGLSVDFAADSPIIQGYIHSVLSTSASEIVKTTEKDLMPIFDDLVNGNGTVDDAKQKIKDLFGQYKNYRPQAIARTEANRINNYASIEAARQGGLEKKVWVSALTSDTREAHAAADGQAVGMDDSFLVGGELLQYPGDPNGSAGNVINCLCTITFI